MINSRETSRHQGRPVRLFLFKGVEPSLEVLMRSVTIIPGTTEFGYGTTPVIGTETGKQLNQISTQPLADFVHTIEDLLVSAPNLEHVSLVIAWHGNDLRVGNCEIRPKVEIGLMPTTPYEWQVGSVQRADAQVVSYISGKPALGGAPSDRTVYEAITFLKSKGLKVTLYPFIMMDVASGNTLPNPYGGTGQPTYPWRGRITCYPAAGQAGTVDTTAAAASQVASFFGTATTAHFSWNAAAQRVNYTGPSSEWSMRRFILHMATIAAAAGADDFLLASELIGITTIRSSVSTFPGVDQMVSLLAQVRSILGSVPKISYAADWSEYHSYKTIPGPEVLTTPTNPRSGWSNTGATGSNSSETYGIYTSAYMLGVSGAGLRQHGAVSVTAGATFRVKAWIKQGTSTQARLNVRCQPGNLDSDIRGPYNAPAVVGQAGGAVSNVQAQDLGGGFWLWSFDITIGAGFTTALVGVGNVSSGLNVHILGASLALPGNDILFPLDPLWANADINYIGIDNYLPMGDWRDGDHLDRQAGFVSPYDKDYIQKHVEGGEYFDWYYASSTDRTNQVRTPIFDGAYGEDWIWRQKDIRGWWSAQHYPRLNGVRQASPTAWTASAKQIVFTELGLPAVDKGINQPNVFVDSKSSESAYPYFSNQRPDAAIQRAALEAVLDYWKKNGAGMVDFDKISLWTWDARPYPTFPERSDYYGDAGNWLRGHWLTGRLRPGFGFDAGEFGPFAFCDGEAPITRAGITYQPFPITISDITSNGNLDKSDITVTMARGSLFENEFIGFPLSHVVNLIVFQGHTNDTPSLFDYPAIWVGRVGAPVFENDGIDFNCVPVSTSIQRPGLRRNYQLSCPHVLFGPQCRASRNAATVERTVTAISGSSVTFNTALPLVGTKYNGGLLEWTADGHASIRTVVSVTAPKTGLSIRGNLRGLIVGSTIKITYGCNRLQTDCADLHQNILNFGGQPFIPLENPLSQKNVFY